MDHDKNQLGLDGLPATPIEALAGLADQLASITVSSPPQRRELIGLLSILRGAVGQQLDAHHQLSADADWVDAHPVTEALGFLVDALKDLDLGVTSPVLKAPRIGGAMKPTSERNIAVQAVDWVRVVEATKGVSRKAACKQVATALTKAGVKVGRKPIDATRVVGWCAGRLPGVKR